MGLVISMSKQFVYPLMIAFSLTGCAASHVEKVDCVAKYTTGTWPSEQRVVQITERRVDRFGNVWVHPKSDLILHFHGRWQKEDLFTEYQCRDTVK